VIFYSAKKNRYIRSTPGVKVALTVLGEMIRAEHHARIMAAQTESKCERINAQTGAMLDRLAAVADFIEPPKAE